MTLNWWSTTCLSDNRKWRLVRHVTSNIAFAHTQRYINNQIFRLAKMMLCIYIWYNSFPPFVGPNVFSLLYWSSMHPKRLSFAHLVILGCTLYGTQVSNLLQVYYGNIYCQKNVFHVHICNSLTILVHVLNAICMQVQSSIHITVGPFS